MTGDRGSTVCADEEEAAYACEGIVLTLPAPVAAELPAAGCQKMVTGTESTV
ncbi:hypothetical protein SPRG_16460 [Saprolegnia parasitica CBS 223.65]|uniref:Uncharacterized protein n=1 Tax=Saprolegnia parasitica (strain CBS 223.65) TaxID=695850 RepID=A0A067BI98_SAPPC|nr:hypothetical protein SPRG_16460 [Saprolegnia parasitica CBS 223.65]KDO18119.1 hypothetical protein SPRG_16460 [Saprolegnia parasitica CBS 223.65]|eukprot:XP_012211178.1 hypothetical protein SPRG_16460 [Saprolegnia parasitica CBS 223.65]